VFICVKVFSSTLDPLPVSFAAICGSEANLWPLALKKEIHRRGRGAWGAVKGGKVKGKRSRDQICGHPRKRSASALICVEVPSSPSIRYPGHSRPFAGAKRICGHLRWRKRFTAGASAETRESAERGRPGGASLPLISRWSH